MLTDVSVKTPQANETTGIVTFNIVGTQNTYNAAGKRVERVENAETTKFYYTGDALLYSTDNGNVLQTENILDLGGSIIASKRFQTPDQAQTNEFANKYYIYNYDVRGSVTNIIGPDGNTVIGYDYDEFGNTQSNGNNSFINDVTFTSSVADTSSSLQYMNARFYQPSTGRFISQDTYSGNPYDPWTHNLYSYCSANPVNYIDPTGHVMNSLSYLTSQKNKLEAQQRLALNQIKVYGEAMDKYRGATDSASVRAFTAASSIYYNSKGRLNKINKDIDVINDKIENEHEEEDTDPSITFVVGQSFSVTAFIFAYELRPTLVFDSQGKVAFQLIYSKGFVASPNCFGLGAATSTVLSMFNVPSYIDLEGEGEYYGAYGSVPIPNTNMNGQAGLNYLRTTPKKPEDPIFMGGEIVAGGLGTAGALDIGAAWGASTTLVSIPLN